MPGRRGGRDAQPYGWIWPGRVGGGLLATVGLTRELEGEPAIIVTNVAGGSAVSTIILRAKLKASTIGGPNSHIVVVARDYNMPCIVGASGLDLATLANGDWMRMTADGGIEVRRAERPGLSDEQMLLLRAIAFAITAWASGDAPPPYPTTYKNMIRASDPSRISDHAKVWNATDGRGTYRLGRQAQHPDSIPGLALWASFPNDDLSQRDLQVLSVWGALDSARDSMDSAQTRARLPADTRFVEIPGGNHEQFGYYTGQANDPVAEITRADQQAQIVAATVELLEAVEAAAGRRDLVRGTRLWLP